MRNLANTPPHQVAMEYAAAMDAPGYETLAEVLHLAFVQAAHGKGKERHANALPFHQQPMQALCDMHGVGFATGQVGKKSSEALALPLDRAEHELLGAIVYAAGAIIAMRRKAARQAANDNTPLAPIDGNGVRPVTIRPVEFYER